jgi:ABC-2 type transport system ATP-binding protein
VKPIAIEHLTKRYGEQTAVDDLSLEVEPGSVCGLLGPNGSGKTTTVKFLLGLARPTSGTLTVGGAPVGPTTFETLVYVPERNTLYEWMMVRELFTLYKRTYKRFDDARAAELAALFKLDSRKRIERLSKGQQTAVALTLAFAIRPEVLVLDEPASGLDPIFQRVVLDLIIDAAAGGATVLFSSHQIGQVERAADRVAIMKGGRLVLDGNVDTLKGDEKIIEAVFEGDAVSPNGLAADPRVRRIERNGRILRAYVRSDSADVVRRLEALGPKAVSVYDLSLEDIFLGAVSDTAVRNGEGT